MMFLSLGAQNKQVGLCSYYKNGEEVMVDSAAFQLYVIVKDSAEIFIIKPSLIDSFSISLPSNSAVELVLKFNNEVMVVPYDIDATATTESWTIGYAKIYHTSAINKMRHYHLPPPFEFDSIWHSRYFIALVYDKHRRLTSLPQNLKWYHIGKNTNILQSNPAKAKQADVVIMLYKNKTHPNWKGTPMECLGTSYPMPTFFSSEYYLIKDFRQYKRKSKKYWQLIETLYRSKNGDKI